MLTLEQTLLILQTRPAFEMTDEQFFQFCQINRNYRIERNSNGELLVMPPAGSETGHYNAKLTQQLGNWSDEDGTGIDFDSSAGFILPNGALLLCQNANNFTRNRQINKSGKTKYLLMRLRKKFMKTSIIS